ncbi:peptidylprolyl isomerase [Opitutaceae bacterium EW11]|nr:peptidylprolyl isomerase [Opitutaceae bacterium EW11]
MRFARILLFVLIAFAPSLVFAQREKLPAEDLEIVQKNWPTAKRTSTSLRTVLLKEGSGANPKAGDMVDVLYTGKLLDGTVFDEALDPQKPFTFRLGRGQVIEGWDEALQLMKPGERRIVIVPFELGYGTRGQPPKIPRRATLVFEVELLSIHK